MKIAIATCADKPNLTAGDLLLAGQLQKLGATVAPVIWSDRHSLDAGWDVVLVRSVWDYHRRPQEFLAWLERVQIAGARLLNSAEVIQWNFEKSYLLDLSRRGVDCVPTLVIPQRSTDPIESLRATGWSTLVVKPAISATAFLTFKTSFENADLRGQVEQIQKHSDVIVQPYLESIETDGEVSLIFFRSKAAEYSHAVLKTARAGDYRVQSDFGGAIAGFEPSGALKSLARGALERIKGEWVFARVDLIDWQSRPLVSEIEMIEPELFLSDRSAADLARSIRTTFQ